MPKLAFGFEIGINPPMDIHIPTPEEIGDELPDILPSYPDLSYIDEDGNRIEMV